jgi:hypothetical protein
VFLDDFGELEKVPLDSYRDRVESFDLRNDGYAERLFSFFVFQGSRRLFIPLKGAGDLEGRLNAALTGIPFSLSVLTPPMGPRSVILPAILFPLAAAFTIFLSGEVLLSALFLPLWAVLAGLGVPGFALMAVLAGLSRLLREPVRDYFIGTLSWRPLWGVQIPGVLFLLAIGGIMILGALPPLTVILGLLFFLIILALAIRAESSREARRGHIRFRSVPISGITMGPSSYARIMAPFTLAALVLLVVPAVFPGFFSGGSARAAASSRDWTGWKSPLTLNAAVYSEHVEFQRAFSLKPLGAPSSQPQAYLRYSLAEDGLIDGAGELANSGELVNSFEIPPFPLEGLIDYLTNYTYTDPGYGSSFGGELRCLLIVPGLALSLIFRERRRPLRLAMYMDKRIAA